ncbi:hypothetical protein HMPREF0970_00536 [Schaalia odontolytica F0309]|uniref:Uncharacterized protein n=1 Tax=Schaalia odontolytica F0309 TaxID=649742 RepID=D4TX79_9ACTO|nr:hypothetical protein HMPREF0970_00536 [Schaalia odontolytica F0309]
MPSPWKRSTWRLNAPFGARCFLTRSRVAHASDGIPSLNAPFGARCFLTKCRP